MSALARLRDALPAGKTLPPDVWARRHRAMVVVIWAHAIAMPIYGLTRGFPLWHSLLEGLRPRALGQGAPPPRPRGRGRLRPVPERALPRLHGGARPPELVRCDGPYLRRQHRGALPLLRHGHPA